MRKTLKRNLRVGDAVSFLLGNRRVHGVIAEDRGPLGADGKRLYRVMVSLLPGESTYFEMPEDEITAEEQTRQAQPA
jgi:hypothetical protein